MYRLILFFCLCCLHSAYAQDEVLQPELAFQFNAKVINHDKIKLSWQIAEGYYLYKEKFHISSSTSGMILNQPTFPTAEVKEDKFFGKVEIYRNHLDIELPITQQNIDLDEIDLAVSYQGCADIGVCYLPIKKQLNLSLDNNDWFDLFKN